MTYLLDSNACIGWLRQSQPKLVARIKQERPMDIEIWSVAVGVDFLTQAKVAGSEWVHDDESRHSREILDIARPKQA
jgi:hypothetical protein